MDAANGAATATISNGGTPVAPTDRTALDTLVGRDINAHSRGGPPIVAPAMLEGFGSKLVHRSMAAQLDGTISFNWSEEGVVVTLRMSKERLAN